MPDEIDRVVERGEAELARRIAAARLSPAAGALFCEDCDAEIPTRRREAHPSATRCMPCQEAQEIARG